MTEQTAQRLTCPRCLSKILEIVMDLQTWHFDAYCAVCGGFVGHWDICRPGDLRPVILPPSVPSEG